MTGIEYPTISVATHQNLVVRFSLAAELLMIRRGLDPDKIPQLISPILRGPSGSDGSATIAPNPKWAVNMVAAFACMVAENFVDRSQPHRVDFSTAPTADYWATQIDDLAAVSKVVIAALGKAAEERRKKLAVVPPAPVAAAG